MIIDLDRFIAAERPHWERLEAILDRIGSDAGCVLTLDQLREFHYLYERASAGLARIDTFACEPELRRYLEALVARAYGEIHETRDKPHRLRPLEWFLNTFPRAFRRHLRAFCLSAAAMLAGALFGGLALMLDSDSKEILMPFGHLHGDPSERVAREEEATGDRLSGAKATFSTHLMTHNTRVSILTLALGVTWGIGTLVILFYNGAILGAVGMDYLMAGETVFLFGWLLPHGSVEIPAILIAGQGGFILGGALIGWGGRQSLMTRLRLVSRDLVTLIFGVAVLLVWAGLVESLFSQYHEPVIPYAAKVVFGAVQLGLLAVFLGRSGAENRRPTGRIARGNP